MTCPDCQWWDANESGLCEVCEPIAAQRYYLEIAFWSGVCAGQLASRREPLDEAWLMFTHTGAWLYEARFWLAVSRLQEAEGWLK